MASLLTWDFYRAWYGTGALASASALREQFDLVNPLVGRMVEDYLGRYVFQADRTETFDARDRRSAFFLRGFPVVSVTSVEVDGSGRFDGDEYVVPATDYGVDANTGRLRLLGVVDDARSGVRVTYTGGLVADQDTLLVPTTDYHFVAVAAAMQVKSILERRDTLGSTSESHGRGSRQYVDAVLLPLVEQALDPIRVWRAG